MNLHSKTLSGFSLLLIILMEKNEGMVRGILVIRINREEKQEERG